MALSQEATVKALIWKGERTAPVSSADPPFATGEIKTRKIAVNLHVAVVTVDLANVAPLDPGELYSYNLTFAFTGTTTSDLQGEKLLQDELAGARLAGVDKMAPLHRALGFDLNRLPTFLAPPRKFVGATPAEGLRIAHCSCRNAAGESFDAFAGLAPLIKQADRRPHQLYMTGDQVYADDISTPLLPLVTSLASDVIGAAQPLPGFPPDPRTGGSGSTPVTGAVLPGNLDNLPPMRRRWLVWQLAGFTGGHAQNHAITFGEFVALHLLAWSPRVWRTIPAFADVFKAPGVAGGAAAPAKAIEPWLNQPWVCSAKDPEAPEATLKADWANATVNVKGFEDFNAAAHHLARFAGATPLAAQVLANIPTSMIFDDHDVTDDWNVNGRWVTKVYHREWGRYVLRNGLMAYTLMQGWGNDPAHFATDKPGKKLLDAIPAAIASGTPAKDIDILLGFDKPTAAQPKRVAFNYSAGNESYKVVVLDTRTHRAVSNTTLDPPNLIDNLDEQLPLKPVAATQEVLVVISPVPVLSPVVIEQVGQPLAQLAIDARHAETTGEVPGFAEGDETDPRRRAGCGEEGKRSDEKYRRERGAEKYDREGWFANEQGFEALIARLASYKSVVILSGDVHFASTMTLDYWTKGTPAPSPARMVQCIASPAKNIFKDVVDQLLRKTAALQKAEEVPVERLAWKAPIDPSALTPSGARLSLARRSRMRRTPALLPTAPWPAGSKLPEPTAPKAPDWRWRIQTVSDAVTKRADLPEGLQREPFADAFREKELPGKPKPPDKPIAAKLAEISRVHQIRLLRNRPLLPRLVFAPNFGTVQFEQKTPEDVVDVIHRLYSPVTAVHPLSFSVGSEPFQPRERRPRPAERPGDPPMQFGPHTVHRTPLKTPDKPPAPTIIAKPVVGG